MTNALIALKQHGADLDAMDTSGRSALAVAHNARRAQLLRALGATRTGPGAQTQSHQNLRASRLRAVIGFGSIAVVDDYLAELGRAGQPVDMQHLRQLKLHARHAAQRAALAHLHERSTQ